MKPRVFTQNNFGDEKLRLSNKRTPSEKIDVDERTQHLLVHNMRNADLTRNDLESILFKNMSEVSSYSAQSVKPLRPFNNYQAFSALLKGYCSINILTIPKAFGDAGWIIGISSIIISAIIQLICAN